MPVRNYFKAMSLIHISSRAKSSTLSAKSTPVALPVPVGSGR
jgi:hypothetical protein